MEFRRSIPTGFRSSRSAARAHLAVLIAVTALSCGDDGPAPDTTGPAAIEDLRVTAVSESTVTLAWTAPDDEGGSATAYDLRYDLSDISLDWEAGTPVFDLPAPHETGDPPPAQPGIEEQVTVSGLTRDTRHSFAIQSWDFVGNPSPTSNVVWAEPADTTAPGPITDLVATALSPESVSLSWTAPGEDGSSGTVSRYELRYGTGAVTWEGGTPMPLSLTPGAPGSTETAEITGLEPSMDYGFLVRAVDDGANYGSTSNEARATTPRLPRTWVVHEDGSGDAPTIQAAIDSSLSGDEIVVGPGTYYENIIFNGKNVWLHSEQGPEVTTIDGSREANSVVRFLGGESRGAVLEGFTITGGIGSYILSTTQPFGGGILCAYDSSPCVRGNLITGNGLWNGDVYTSGSGGGMLICLGPDPDHSAPLIEDNRFVENEALLGGGLFAGGHCHPVIRRNMFSRNTSGTDGAAIFYLISGGSVEIEDNRFVDNSAGDKGGAILASGSSGMTWITRNLFLRNTAMGSDIDDRGVGGAILIGGTIEGTVTHNTIVGNDGIGESPCGVGGLLLFQTPAALIVEYNLFFANTNCAIGCTVQAETIPGTNLFWANTPTDLPDSTRECLGEWRASQIIADPLFCDPANDDYRLQLGSPAITPNGTFGAFPDPGCP